MVYHIIPTYLGSFPSPIYSKPPRGPFVQSPQFASVFLDKQFLHRVRFSPFLKTTLTRPIEGAKTHRDQRQTERCTSVSPKRSLEAKERTPGAKRSRNAGDGDE